MSKLHTHQPRHPSCAALSNGAEPCTCDAEFGFNGGDDPARAIEIAERMDNRKQESHYGRGSDQDEEGGQRQHQSGGKQHTKPDGHFWKRSEFLKCNAGVPMKDLDMSRFRTPEWQRAKEASA